MSDRIVRYWFRATCFGDPVAPWRDSLTEARRDLISLKLGSYDEWGLSSQPCQEAYYVIAPGLITTSGQRRGRRSVRQPRGLPEDPPDNGKCDLPTYNDRSMRRVS